MEKKTEKTYENLPAITTNTDIYLNPPLYDHAVKVALTLSGTDFIPDSFKKKPGNCLIALCLSSRMGIDVVTLMQNMMIIYGKPGIEAKLILALINDSGRFHPVEYEEGGEGDDRYCIAYAEDKRTGRQIESIPITVKMAKAEGWWGKKGSKWPNMTGQMLRYRSVTFFGRAHCPGILMGMHTVDELRDVGGTDAVITMEEDLNAHFAEVEKVVPFEQAQEEAPGSNTMDSGGRIK